MRQGSQKLRWLPVLTATVMVGVFGAVMPARSECLSPSAEAGATATTVYRCPDENAAGAQLPIVIDPEKTTEVERGSAKLPWFEPKPSEAEDPIETTKAPSGNKGAMEKKEDVAKIPPPPAEVTKPEAADREALPAAAKAKTAKPKPAMAKPAKVKQAKAKRTKSKLAKKKQTKTQTAKAQASQQPVKTKTKTAKAQASQQPVKTEPAKADEKVFVWTKKDMPIGSRIKNWFGF